MEKVYSDSTLKQWTKDKLIEYIQILTQKYNEIAVQRENATASDKEESNRAAGVTNIPDTDLNANYRKGLVELSREIKYARHAGFGKKRVLDRMEKLTNKYLGKEES